MTPHDRALVCLDGLALGDAFGESFFGRDARERIEQRMLRPTLWRWTDDTAMALSIVETLTARGRIDQDDLATRLVRRYLTEPGRGYGAAMHRGLSAVGAGDHWRAVAVGQFDGQGSFGNGAAMRAPVVGAWFADDLERVEREARLSAEVTHTHPEGVAGAIAIGLAAALASRPTGPSGQEFVAAILDRVPPSQVAERVRASLTLAPETPIARAVEVLGNGSNISAQDTVPLTIWCAAQHTDDYPEALWLTVSALGDRDTTCAMVGGIVACRVGAHGLPADWLAYREPLPPPDERISLTPRRKGRSSASLW